MQSPSGSISESVLKEARPLLLLGQQHSAFGVHRSRLSANRCSHNDFATADTSKAHSRLKSLKLLLFRAPFVERNQLPRVHLRLVFLFFSLFLFFNLNFLGGNIKTEKVTVQTDEIFDSAAKLVATPKTLVTDYEGLKMLKDAPEGSFLKRLSTKEFLEIDLNHFDRMKANVNRYVVLGNEVALVQLIILLSQHAHRIGAVAFRKSTVYYESLVGFRMRRSLEEERKRFINAG